MRREVLHLGNIGLNQSHSLFGCLTYEQWVQLFLDLDQLFNVLKLKLLNDLCKQLVCLLLGSVAVKEHLHSLHKSHIVLFAELDFFHDRSKHL